MAKQRGTDWAAVEADFRAGKLSNVQIANKFGVTEGAIRKRAKAGGWVRTSPAVSYQPRQEIIAPAPRPRAGDGDDPVEMGQDLARRMLGELDMATTLPGEIEDAIYDETRDDANGRRREMMLKAVSLPARAMTLKTIAQALAVLKEVSEEGSKGKKQQRQENAEKAASGRFAPPAPPKLVVDNGK